MINSYNIISRLRAKYAPPEYAFFAEVGDQTGGRNGSADGIAMSLWPSRGLEIIGFEVKVDRGDWTRELKNPAKAEAFARYCDRWFLVVSDVKIVQPGELPPTWGLLAPRGDGLVVKVPASKLEPTEMGRKFVAAVLRAVQKDSPTEEMMRKARLDGREEGIKHAAEQSKYNHDHAAHEVMTLRKSLTEFEAKSGITIDLYNGGRIGEAVSIVQGLYAPSARSLAEKFRDEAKLAAKRMTELLDATEESPSALKLVKS